jgi:protein ImuA
VHEFICNSTEDASASGGFIAGVLANLMRNGGVSLWISSSRKFFPPALKSFSIEPDKIIFVDLQKEKDILWAIEEALKCESLVSVIAEMKELSFTASRRFQLAVEQSGVTAFILRLNPRNPNITAAISRWKITHLPTMLTDNTPGVGFPRWNVELLKIRNGKPGSWQIEWIGKRFRHLPVITPIPLEQQKKTG